MTVRGLLLAGAILASAPVPAASACHRYSIWRYPQPQRCGAHFGQKRENVRIAPVRGPSGPDLPLPALDRPADAEADGDVGLRLHLLGAAYGH